MNHVELVHRAAQWLRVMGCPIVFAEMRTLTAEEPDAIGWRDSGRTSLLIECKASRSDFFADKHKAHRWDGVPALGRYRYYMTPPAMVRRDEVPERWGLLYCHPKTVEVVCGKHPRRWEIEAHEAFGHKPAFELELRMFYSALNRLRLDLGDADFSRRVHMTYEQRKRLKSAGSLVPHPEVRMSSIEGLGDL